MNYKIAIDPGHGGGDLGNTGNDLIEKDYALLISNYIKGRLDDLKIENITTRNTDRNITIPERIDVIENSYGNEKNVIVISNHLNKGSGKGLEIIYQLKNTNQLAKTIADQIEQIGGEVNKYYQLRDPNNTNEDYNQLLKDTPNYQTIMIEYGYVNNSEDAKNLKSNYQKYGEAVVKAIANYTNTKYVPLPDSNYYVVKKGDSLYKIATNYKITVDELKKANNLTSNNLDIGQILYLPIENKQEEETTYTVKSGDTLYKIAASYNIAVEKLKQINNLATNTLQIGQILTIPGSETSSSNTYTVKSGDTLYKIAASYNIAVEKLKQINNLTTNTLQIGQKIKIK